MSKIQEANVLIDRVKTTLNQLQNASGIRDACNTRNEAGNYLNSVPNKVEVSTNTSGEIYVKDKETINVSVNTENINCISKELQVDRVDLSSQEKAAAESIEEVLVSPLFKETKNNFNEDVDENCKNVAKSDEETDTEEPLKEEPRPCRKFRYKSEKVLGDTISIDQASIGSEFIIDYQSLMKDTDPRPKTRRKPDCHVSRSGETLTSIESNCDCPFDPIMEYVHAKLQAISENSENDSNSEEKVLDDEEAKKLVHETNKILDGKSMPLSIQQMPSINIPGSLVLEPTLNLSINSEGVAKNNLPNKSNISYGEVLVNGRLKQRQPPASEDVKSLPSLSSKTRIPKVTLDDSVSTSTPKIEMKDPVEESRDTTESVMVEIKPLDESNLFELTFSSVNLAKSNTDTASSIIAISTEQDIGDKESEMQSDVTKDEVSLSTEAPGVDKALQSVKSTEISEKPPKETSTFNITPKEDEDCVVVYRSYHILPQNRAVSVQRNYRIKVSSATKLKKDNLAFYRTFINPLTSSSSDSSSVHDEQDGTIKIQSKTDISQHLVHPATKLETYGFLRTAATQCDLSKENVVEQSDTGNATPPISAEVQSNANKNSDESVELVIKLESNSTELCTDFAKQFDLKKDKMLVKQIVEMEHPVKECSPTSSGRNSTSNQTHTDEFSSGRISGRRVKVKKVFQPLCLDNYEIKNRSIGISPRIPSRRSRLKHLTDTSATESLSEGEIRCCNTSMGEVHNHPKAVSRQNKSVFVKKFPKIYSIENSNVQVEQHRHYFNNWVTYYVSSKNREYVNDTSSTSSSYK